MKKIIFDIETSGCSMQELSDSQQEYLLRYAVKEKDETARIERIDETERYLSLYPFTAKVVAIGMLEVESEKSLVYFESAEEEEWKNDEKKIKYRGMTEENLLLAFWDIAAKVDQFITFNGRNFDVPFLMLRSSILKIKPTRNLLHSRYDTKAHIDLLEQLTFYGLVRKFNLDFYCRAYGVESPKSKGVTGMEVKTLYEAGRIKEVAIYCGDDIKATYELYKIWNEYLNI